MGRGETGKGTWGERAAVRGHGSVGERRQSSTVVGIVCEGKRVYQ